MAYRGGSSSSNTNSNKRPLGQSPGGSGFESQFSELASFQADVQQPNKRQRTNTGGRSGPNSRISPLKFDNNKVAGKFQVVPTSCPSTRPVASNAGTKFISKPILPSQKISQIKEAENEDLWGDDDDGCEDLLLAASQVIFSWDSDLRNSSVST